MADGAAAATSEIAKASMAIDGFTKNVQAAALYTKMYNKAFGPFYDLWIKGKANNGNGHRSDGGCVKRFPRDGGGGWPDHKDGWNAR